MIINTENLSKEYKIKVKDNLIRRIFKPTFQIKSAVNNITFSINKGESVALLGPNGAGKTTTMKMLTGLIYPTSGRVEVLGYFPFDRKPEFLMEIGLVMGNKFGLDWDLTPKQSFELIRKIYKVDDQLFISRIKEMTELLEVSDYLDTQVRKLSLGERMKMELIGSIIHNPKILFLDEPTIGLDIISKQKIRNFLREIQRKYEVTLLLTSHDMDDVERVCDRVIIINKGIKVYDDALDTLMREHTKDRYVKFIFRELTEDVGFGNLGTVFEKGDNFIVVKTKSEYLSDLISGVTSKYRLADIDILSVPLEEIIADIYQKSSLK